MFRKPNKNSTPNPSAKPAKSRESIPTIITADVHLLGNLVSEGAVDFSGTIDGNVRCESLTLRSQGTVKGEISAHDVQIQGTVKGLIRAKNVHLSSSCKVEGIIIHEQLSIEDGAFVDGKFKRSDRLADAVQDEESTSSESSSGGGQFDNSAPMLTSRATGNTKMLENIRLIR